MTAQGGDLRAIGMLYRYYYQRLSRYAYKIGGTRELAQEAIQDAWIRAMKTLTRLEDPRAFRSWMYTLVRWRVIDLLRTADRYCQEQEEPLDQATTLEVDDEGPEALRLAINRLPSLERQIIHLFYLDELQVKEIASVLNIASGTVKSRLNRARKLLRQRFKIN
ncbi:MAG: sigma-70 family RNA polymerase sigma factor [Pseudomonadales bacterium]|nr:sigma-70 family RNA polymerase sigma factor [Pseudomonadales bacterium]